MASLENFIYCLSTERVDSSGGVGSNINAMGILATITPEYVPGSFSFSIIFTILGVDITRADNSVRMEFKKVGDEKSLVDTGTTNLPAMPENDDIELPEKYKGLNMSIDCRNIVFESEGLYVTKIYFNNDFIGEKQIYVKGKRKNE